MSDYYQFVPGNLIWPYDLYSDFAKNAGEKDILIEVGTGFGRGACFMTEKLAQNNSKAKFYVIDTFGNNIDPNDTQDYTLPWVEDINSFFQRLGGSHYLIDVFDFYMRLNPYNKYLTGRVQFPPATAANEFLDNTVTFVMLNASRDTASVYKQLLSWWPKIKENGVIAVYNGNDTRILNAITSFGKGNPIHANYRTDLTTILRK